MTAMTYHDLALEWHPRRSGDNSFTVLAVSVLVGLLALALVISNIEVPREERTIRAVPERIAQFIMEKEKPKPILKPVIKKIPERTETKPLTETQQKAREKAADSGLLALSKDLVDLMDTSAVNSMLSGKVNSAGSASQQVSSVNKGLLMAEAGKGGVSVNSGQYTSIGSQTTLSSKEVAQVKASLVRSDAPKTDTSKTARSTSGSIRADEEITIVFDQNKSKLYSLYSRARRTNPGLKGKIVLQITIEPTGKVSKVKVLSSELNDSGLESSLISRIKLFDFGVRSVEPVTVTYPIEFLPS
ncbi:MAG: energy transducer TonB [Gammaproteobacteria bacterium]|nr:energy transducer TonB [Gammaproteobacteria bacterium]